jgi:hypothetical protein
VEWPGLTESEIEECCLTGGLISDFASFPFPLSHGLGWSKADQPDSGVDFRSEEHLGIWGSTDS